MKRLGPWFYAPLGTGYLPRQWAFWPESFWPEQFERLATSLIYQRFRPAALASVRDLWFDCG